MSFFSSSSGASVAPMTHIANMFKVKPLPHEKQQHMAKVFATLFLVFCAANLGVALEPRLAIGPGFSVLLALGCMLLLFVDRSRDHDVPRRLCYALGFGFFKGVSIAPLVTLAQIVDPAIVTTALLLTALIFGSFTLMALMDAQGSYLWLGSVLMSAVTMLFYASIGTMLFGTGGTVHQFFFQWQVYAGLVVFSLYVLYDVQLILLKVSLGDDDFLVHALELFIDFVAIFVRILIILLQNAGDKKKNSNGGGERRKRTR